MGLKMKAEDRLSGSNRLTLFLVSVYDALQLAIARSSFGESSALPKASQPYVVVSSTEKSS
jgi:hypothetical protein